jgi:hypothetical protein
MLAILIGLVVSVLVVWLLPFWLVPWVLGFGVLVWAYVCVVRSGYPFFPTAVWAVPVALATTVGTLIASPWARVAALLGIGALLTLYAYEPAR